MVAHNNNFERERRLSNGLVAAGESACRIWVSKESRFWRTVQPDGKALESDKFVFNIIGFPAIPEVALPPSEAQFGPCPPTGQSGPPLIRSHIICSPDIRGRDIESVCAFFTEVLFKTMIYALVSLAVQTLVPYCHRRRCRDKSSFAWGGRSCSPLPP